MKNRKVSRRGFLRLSTTIGAGAFFIPDTIATSFSNEGSTELNAVPVRPLGKTGIKLPILSMGVDRADSNNVLRAAYNSGIFHFDTAHDYQKGRNEEMIGRLMEGKPRDSFFVSTKLAFEYPLSDNFEQDMLNRLDISLKRLKMDYVDIFYLHTIHVPIKLQDERIVNLVKEIKRSGKARFIGFSSHDQKPEILHAGIDVGIYDVALLSYNFKMKNMEETNAAIDRAVKAGMGIIAMKAMAGGTEDAEGKKKINAQACLKWIWQNENITTVIPGFFNFDQLDECLTAAKDPIITFSEKEYLADIGNKEGLYCQQCGNCRTQCPQGLPIPDIMRAYMYTYGYKHALLSKETLSPFNLPQNVCASCDDCRVECPSGFNVSKKIAAILPVMQISNEFLT